MSLLDQFAIACAERLAGSAPRALLKVTGAFVGQFAEHVGGAQGCARPFDLSVDVLRLFKFGM
jgi:hypothetical protein